MEELWKDVVGYNGKYQVSNRGSVRSLSYAGQGICKLRKLEITSRGYCQLSLYIEGVRKVHSVHRLVAEAFIPNPGNLPEVNHIDENKSNNYVENLEWCTRKYNVNYGTSSKRSAISQSKAVIAMNDEGEIMHKFLSTAEAGRNGFHQTRVSACCNKLQKTHKGLYWEYV